VQPPVFRGISTPTIAHMIEPGRIPAHIRPESAAEGLSGLAQRQHGVVSRAQLHAQGVAGTAITRWLRAGRLHRIHPHVYALGHRAIPLEGQLWAALLYAGGGAVLSHTTAAWIWSLIDAEPRWIDLVARDRRRSLPGVRVQRRRLVERADCRGLPVTSVARTLLDLAGTLSYRQLRRAMSEADYRGLLDPSEIAAVLGRGRSGSRALRRALGTHLPELAQTVSVLEERFFELCEMAGLPLPEVNASVGSMRVDALWPAQRVAVELDGGDAHGSWAQIKRDRQRELALRAKGLQVVRYTWEQITTRADEVAADLWRLLRA
jgi:predicted transcriptional regulator of viral defense system